MDLAIECVVKVHLDAYWPAVFQFNFTKVGILGLRVSLSIVSAFPFVVFSHPVYRGGLDTMLADFACRVPLHHPTPLPFIFLKIQTG